MMNIKYTITFFSEWHAGSGLTSGSDLNALVIKGKNKLPFIPGRTLKGLLREAAEDLTDLNRYDKDFINQVFGIGDAKNQDQQGNDDPDVKSPAKASGCFFTNAKIPERLSKVIVKENLESHFYRSFASTAVTGEGIADPHSLHTMETCIPCTLEAEILNVPDDYKLALTDCFKWIKRLGQNRNRGLGRCQFEINK